MASGKKKQPVKILCPQGHDAAVVGYTVVRTITESFMKMSGGRFARIASTERQLEKAFCYECTGVLPVKASELRRSL